MPKKAFIAHRFRLYPTPDQEKTLAQMFGNTRFLYNKLLATVTEAYSLGQPYPGKFTLMKLIPAFQKQYSFLQKTSVTELRHTVENLDHAFLNFFAKRSKFPKFKKRSNRQSLTASQGTRLVENLLKIEGLKNIPVNLDKRAPKIPKGHPKLATITKEPSGKYFAVLTWDTGTTVPEPYQPTGIVAFDEGISTQIAMSYGRKLKSPKPFVSAQKKLRRAQRTQARRKKGSRNREKARVKVARIHEKIANIRDFHLNSFIHHEVRKAKAKNQGIAFQASNHQNQLKNRKLSKALSDVANGAVVTKFKQECQKQGVPTFEIDQWEPTSPICHKCGARNHNLELRHRKWRCEGCNTLHDRDVNAGKVIEQKALQQLIAQGTCVNAWPASAGRIKSNPEAGITTRPAGQTHIPRNLSKTKIPMDHAEANDPRINQNVTSFSK